MTYPFLRRKNIKKYSSFSPAVNWSEISKKSFVTDRSSYSDAGGTAQVTAASHSHRDCLFSSFLCEKLAQVYRSFAAGADLYFSCLES